MKQDYLQDPELGRIVPLFRKAVRQNKNGYIREKIARRVLPPLTVSASLSIPFFLGVFEYAPPMMRGAAVVAGLLTLGSSFFWDRKAGSLNISRKEVIDTIDSNLDQKAKSPARHFDDVPAYDLSDTEYTLWRSAKLDLWEQFGDKLAKMKPHSTLKNFKDFHPASRALPYAALFAAAALVYSGDNLQDKWDTLMDWKGPPPPLSYQVVVTPPDNIAGTIILTDAMVKQVVNTENKLSPHDRSTITVITYDRPAAVTVDGKALDAQPDTLKEEIGKLPEFTYSFVLTPEVQQISIDNKYAINFKIAPDNSPFIKINSINPSETDPSLLELEYDVGDDNAVTGVRAKVKIVGQDGTQDITPQLKSNELPQVLLPY